MLAVASEKPQVQRWAEELHASYIKEAKAVPHESLLPNNATTETLVNLCSSVMGLKNFLENSATMAREEKSEKQ